MAFILHGSCHHSHLTSHPHSHSHSHSPKPVTRHKYAPLNNEICQSHEDDVFIRHPNAVIGPGTVNGGNVLLSRSDSICSYRSPSHSRTNSFSKKITSHEPRRTSIPTAMLHMKLTETMNHRNSFDGISERSFNQHKHRNVHDDDGKNECEIAGLGMDEQSNEFSKRNINIQAAVIHVLGDFIQSIGVFAAALVIKFYVSFVNQTIVST